MTHIDTTEAPAVSFIPKTPQEAAKALLVVAVTLFAFTRSAAADGFSPIEGLQFVIQAVTLIPVFLLSGVAVKTVAAFVLAGLQALAVPFGVLVGWADWGSITFDDWAGAVLGAFAAVGIFVIPNAPARQDLEPAPVKVVNPPELGVISSTASYYDAPALNDPHPELDL
jgi:hypothetical protein